MRRAGQNPTESEVQDMINKIDDGTASLNFQARENFISRDFLRTIQIGTAFYLIDQNLFVSFFLVVFLLSPRLTLLFRTSVY